MDICTLSTTSTKFYNNIELKTSNTSNVYSKTVALNPSPGTSAGP